MDCGLAGTVMRFVPPVAALSTGAVAFDGDPQMRQRPIGEVLDALRALGVAVATAAGAAVHRARRRLGPRRDGGRRRVGVVASSSPRCCSPAPGSTHGVDVRHDGEPVPRSPTSR